MVLSDIILKETLIWRLKLLQSAAAYANSRLHAVRAESLVLAGGNDNLLPSRDEAYRLKSSLKNCKVRCFKDNGHSMLMTPFELFQINRLFRFGTCPAVFSTLDDGKIVRGLAGVPDEGSNLFRLLSSKSHVLLYPGGQREALHNKCQFWESSEIVAVSIRKCFFDKITMPATWSPLLSPAQQRPLIAFKGTS
ncbi:hypothetical protein NC653_012925 [Populus alba x Populus x berolinensis]|uniref:Uncharacterized protein n=1 Tax=Populus alba x Populus x berolinensis TaxID=444605 RepID=A0AAD6QT67_9ROSI|nr:hypothetical protein NC653_012925 [Populus alba x Populus x berolinensis]